MENEEFLREQFLKYLNGESSAAEAEQLLRYIQSGEGREYIKALIAENMDHTVAEELANSVDVQSRLEETHRLVKQQIAASHAQHGKIIRILWVAGIAAATLIIGSFIGKYIYQQRNIVQSVASVKYDVAPGRNKAILTLANGSKINLNDAANGTIAKQSGIQISKTNNGQLVYQVIAANADHNTIQYNTISTPNGGQYQVILPDNTKVWLNAASSLRYPTRFEGKERLVMLTGEGYFEVAHNKQMPFIVSSAGQQVQVLGTHFNIKSYPDEATITTLLEGSVKVKSAENKNSKAYLLKPGQQAMHVSGLFNIQPADIAANTAWKDGQFIFHQTDLKTIMLQIQRWYDVKVDLGSLPDEQFNAAMNRDVKLSQVLQMLELTSNLKFKIEERRIMLIK